MHPKQPLTKLRNLICELGISLPRGQQALWQADGTQPPARSADEQARAVAAHQLAQPGKQADKQAASCCLPHCLP